MYICIINYEISFWKARIESYKQTKLGIEPKQTSGKYPHTMTTIIYGGAIWGCPK